MPTSGKERIVKFREKLKGDKEKYEEYLKKERERHKIKREKQKAKQNDDKKLRDCLRMKNRDRVRAHRLKKKNNSKNVVPSPLGTYKCLQSFGKAVRRVKNVLPNSPNKIEAVVKKVVSDVMGPDIAKQLCKINYYKDKGNKVTEETKQVIKDFYFRDDVSRQAPGMQDCITVKDPVTGKRTKKQKRHMVTTIAEAFEYFKTVHADINIQKSTFFDLRPKEVLPVALTPHNVCVCAQHFNFIYLMDAIRKCIPSFPKSHNELFMQLSCDVTNENCMTSSCKDCPKHFWAKFDRSESETAKAITWKQWVNLSNHPKVASITGTCAAAIEELKNRTNKFKLHCFVKRIQSLHFEQAKENIAVDEAVVQIDFAENYSLISQDEIQSAHWNHEQVTILTCCIWLYGNEVHESLVIISDDRSHSKQTVWCFLQKIILYIQKLKDGSITAIKIFSDNCAAQFKNRFTLSALCRLKEITYLKDLEWDFFASSHGKGAVDGIGGTVKRLVWTAVKSRQVIVNSAKEFCDHVKSKSKGIHAEYVSKEEIEDESSFLNVLWNNVQGIPQIQTKHHFKVRSNSLHVARTAASPSVEIVTFSLGDCALSAHSDAQEKDLQFPALAEEHSETDINEPISLDDSDSWSEDDLLPLQKVFKSNDESLDPDYLKPQPSGLIQAQNTVKRKLKYSEVYTDSEDDEHNNNTALNVKDIKPNVFVLVEIRLSNKSHKTNTIYKYVGICQSSVQDDGDVRIMFLKITGDNARMFIPNENDISDVPFEDIICKLPCPSLKCKGNRTFYEFEQEVDVFEK